VKISLKKPYQKNGEKRLKDAHKCQPYPTDEKKKTPEVIEESSGIELEKK
jgi:hypothetical protein